MKKRLLSLLLAFSMVFSLISVPGIGVGAAIPSWADSGTGAEENPYIITTEAGLRGFASAAENSPYFSGEYIKLGKDITLTSEWTPINSNFAGTFDGDGYAVKDLDINITSGGDAAFFEGISADAVVKNLNISGSVTSSVGYSYTAAGVVGYNRGKVINCSMNGTVSMTGANGFAGGVVGYNEGNILNCFSLGSVSSTFGAGGIAGSVSNSVITKIVNCFSAAAITGAGNASFGILGGTIEVNEDDILWCYYLDSIATHGACGNADSNTYALCEDQMREGYTTKNTEETWKVIYPSEKNSLVVALGYYAMQNGGSEMDSWTNSDSGYPVLKKSVKTIVLNVNSWAENDNADRADGAIYKTVNGALAKAQKGDIIRLSTDINANAEVLENKEVTLDLYGCALIGIGYGSTIANKGKLRIIDSSEAAKQSVHYFKYKSAGAWELLSECEDPSSAVAFENLDTSTPVDSTTVIAVKGGVIAGGAGRIVSEESYGGGIENMSTGVLTIEGGLIAGNSSTYGGGVYNNGEMTVTGGYICGNGAYTAGAGMYNKNKLTMVGGTVSRNNVEQNNYAGAGVQQRGTMIVGGSAVIKNNFSKGSNDNLALGRDVVTISTETPFVAGAELWVNRLNQWGPVTSNGAETDLAYFKPDVTTDKLIFVPLVEEDPAHLELATTSETVVCVVNGTDEYTTLRQALTGASTDKTAPTVIKLKTDVTESITVEPNTYVELDLNGHVLRGWSADAAIANYGDLTVKDSNGDGLSHKFGESDGLWVLNDELEGEAILHTVTGGVITGGEGYCEDYESSSLGGAVINEGTLTLKAGTLAGNAADNGGAVYNAGALTLDGAVISGNTAAYGGGVYNKGSFEFKSGSITGNTGSCLGGGLYNCFGYSAVMTGGSVTGNRIAGQTDYSGAGVYQGATLTVGGKALIRDNKTGEALDNLFLDGNPITISTTAPFEEGAEIWLNCGIRLGAVTTNGSKEDLAYLKTDLPSCELMFKEAVGSQPAHWEFSYVRTVGTGGEYESVEKALKNASTDEAAPTRIRLLENIAENVTVSAGAYVILDLNGYVLSTADDGPVIINEGNLTVIDSDMGDQSHSFTETDGLWVLDDELQGEEILHTVDGGVITGGTGRDNGASFIEGGGIFNSDNAKLTLLGGTIAGNTAGYGGGVYNKGVLLLDGATVCGNTAKQGGGVFNDSTLVTSFSLTVKSGSITKNIASEWGGGIYNQISAELTLLGGSVTDNTITAASGAHYTDFGGAGIFQFGKLTVGGTAVVRNNRTNSSNDNIHLVEKLITISTDTTLTSGAELWLNLGKDRGAVTNNGASSDAAFFHADSSDCNIFFVAEAGETAAHLELDRLPVCKIEGKGEFPSIAKALIGASEDPDAPTKIVMIRDDEENVEIPADVYVELDLNGFVLKGEAVFGEDHCVIVNYGNLTVKDSAAGQETAPVRYFTDEKCYHDIAIGDDCEGCGEACKDGSFETYTITAPEDMTNVITVIGGVITGGATCCSEEWIWADMHGGAVANYGTLTLTGINIVGNHAVYGAVYNDSALQVTGTVITGNYSEYGGGIYNDSNGYMTVSESKILRNGAACGGGVYNVGGGEIKETEVSCNAATDNGGGIYDCGAGLSITDSKISCNTAGDGGGILSGGVTIVSGSEIKDNTASNLGGGVSAYGMLTFTNCTVSGNTSPCGGGFYVGAYLTLDSTTVTGNTSALGGGILNYGLLTVGGTTKVKNNTDGEYASNLMTLLPFTLGTGEEENMVSVPESGMDIGVNLVPDGFYSSFGAFTDNGEECYTSYFSSDMNYPVAYNETGTYLELLDKPEANLSAVMGKDGKVVWTGNAVSDPSVTATDSEGTAISGLSYEFTWYDGEGIDELSPREGAPVEIGLYTVAVTVGPRAPYKGYTEVTFRIDPVMLEGEDEHEITDPVTYDPNTGGTLILASGADYEEFIRAEMTGEGGYKKTLVQGDDFTVSSGSIIRITLTEKYMQSLEGGTYTLSVYSGLKTGEGEDDWLMNKGVRVEFVAETDIIVISGCKYEACFAAGANVTLLLGGKAAGKFTIAKVSCGYTIQDGSEYIALSADGKSIVRQAGSYTWKYDGGLYGEMKTTTTSKGFFRTRRCTKTTKVYLAMGTEDLTVSSKSAAAKLQMTGSHEWAYKDNNDGSTHTVYCSHCGKEKTSTEQHDYSYDETNHKCICGKIDPDYCGVKTVTVKETSKTSKSYGSRRCGWSSRSKTTYTYTISTTQVNVKVKTIAYSLLEGGAMKQIKSNQFTSDTKLSGFYIDVTDSNGVVTHWYYDGTKTTQLEEQRPQ